MPPRIRHNLGPLIVIVAVPFEGAWIVRRSSSRQSISKKPFPVMRLVYGGAEFLLAESGIGKVPASATTAFLAERYTPACIVSLGICGAYPGSGLTPGDLAFATEEILADEGVTDARGRFHPMESLNVGLPVRPRRRKPNRYPVHANCFSRAALLLYNRFETMATGAFLTVSTATGTAEQAGHLERMWGGICENMEGGAVAQVCERYGIPFLELRGISNVVGPRNLRYWKKELAARNVQEAFLYLLEQRHVWLEEGLS